ncbi:MAG: carbohydrate-binding family 9-like protein [Myxococcota bacterium]|jgi:hypothetical protein
MNRYLSAAVLVCTAPVILCGCTKRSEMVAPPDRQYLVKRATGPIVLDGDLSDAAWKNAERTGAFGFANGQGGTPRYRTEAMMLWDDQNLYIGFEVEDNDIWAGYTRDQEPLYDEEVVEFFANPNDDMREYYEFQVNPVNAHFTAFFTQHRSDLKQAMQWSGPWKSAVKVNGNVNKRDGRDKGWSVEMVLPFSMFQVIGGKAPKQGSHWRADMFRFERPSRGKITEAHGWAPTPSWDFHSMKDWGWIVFGP